MSGICGIVRFDGDIIDDNVIQLMVNATPHRGVDGTHIWHDKNVGLGHLALNITPESCHEQQPLVQNQIVLAADARVDNRDELIRLLNVEKAIITDADLILAAYQRWGLDCPAKIIGDFAFAIWDQREKRLFLARDPMGMRALYYRLESDKILFGTELKQIIAVPGVPKAIFEPALAAYLAGGNMPSEWTFYEGIDQLTAGHALLFEKGKQRLWRYWDINPDYRITYKKEDEYADHFRELFKVAVASRLRSVKPIGISLSGGIDSMSVASTVGWFAENGIPQNYPEPLYAFCHAFTEIPECDERHISSIITDHFGFPSIDVPTEKAYPLKDYPAHGPDRDEPYMGVYQPLIEMDLSMAQERGVGVMLYGGRGDLLTSGWSYNYWDKVLTGRWRDLWNEIQADSQASKRSIQTVIYRQMILPNHRAPKLRKMIRRLLGRESAPVPIYPYWINDEFASRTQLEQIAKQHQSPPSPITDFGRKWRYELIFTDIQMRGSVWSDRDCSRFGMEYSDPWSDRRLAEYILAIPYDKVNKPREYKYIARKAMAGVMPEPALQTVKKILPLDYYYKSMRVEARDTLLDLIDNSIAHELGYIDKAKLRSDYESMMSGNEDHPNFWWTLTVEMWLREFWM